MTAVLTNLSMWHAANTSVASKLFLHDVCAFHFVKSTAASSNFRFLVLRTFFFSKMHLHPALFCILRFSKLLAQGVEVHPTWRWGLFCQRLLSSESCWLAEALLASWQWAGQFCEAEVLWSLENFKLAWQSYGFEILFSDFESGAEGSWRLQGAAFPDPGAEH